MDVIINDNKDSPPLNSKLLNEQGSFELNFLSVLGFDIYNPPLGDFLRQYYQLDGNWVAVSPIHWQVTHNDALITLSGEALNLSQQESHEWFKVVAEFLSEEHLHLHYHDSVTWLLRVDNKPPIKSSPVHLLLNQSLMPHLEKMDATLYWQRLFTELQMFLSNHRLKHQRVNGPVINGLWIYGSGQFYLEKEVQTDDLQFLQAFSDKAGRFELTKVQDNKGIVLLKHMTQRHLAELTDVFKDQNTNWYWNNKAYQTDKKRWWNKLWRKLVNAN